MNGFFYALLAVIACQKSFSSADVICPDQKSACPDDTTCCQLPTKQWGCCPMASAVCCSDGLHCCPARTTCNLEAMTCENQTSTGDAGTVSRWMDAQQPPAQDDVVCPDGKKTCPSSNTCCKMGNPPDWGCCQFPHAVCCPDRVHCCPHGSVCNGSSCTKKCAAWAKFWPVGAVLERKLSSIRVQCPDGSACDEKSTCCRMKDDRWGCSWTQEHPACGRLEDMGATDPQPQGPSLQYPQHMLDCPFINGVCCFEDFCCPSGYQCDISKGQCRRFGGLVGIKWVKRYQAILSSPIICPDQESQCPDNTTCCELESGDYGCCPMPTAVCCEDKLHCCPHGTTCDVERQKCNKGSISTPWFEKSKAYPKNDIACPDHKSKCPNGATCCPLSDSGYGCCPLPQAVCCQDHLHCCPTGTTCDIEEGSCISARGTRVPWFLKFKPKNG